MITPKTIWAQVSIRDPDYGTYATTPVKDVGNVRYTRADLPPTLSAAMQLPEVKAMKEALELARNRLQRLAIEFPTESEGRYEVNEWVEEATAALAAIKEPKT